MTSDKNAIAPRGWPGCRNSIFSFNPFKTVPIVLFCITCVLIPSSGAETLVIDADRQFAFAEHLLLQENFDRAIAEYERFLYFFPEDSRAETARYQMGMAHMGKEDYPGAVDVFMELVEPYGNAGRSITEKAVQAYFRLSECHARMGNPDQAAICLDELIVLSQPSDSLASLDLRDESLYRTGWIYLEADQWEKSRWYFNQISTGNQDKYHLKKLSQEMAKSSQIPRKSPELAGLFSVIPGAGYLYCGRYHDALIAFLLNGGLMAAAYTAFDDDNPALGSVITLAGLGFYAGSMYGSVGSAHKYNRRERRVFIDRIKQDATIHLSAADRGKSVIFCVSYTF
jgi:tetratricopeptide (TPR) repeat protein